MSSLSRASFFRRLSSRRSSLASINSWTSEGGRGEADRQPPLAGGDPQAEGHMGLAGPAVADGDHVLTPVDVLASRQLHDQVLVHRRHGQEAEGVETLDCREACCLDPAVHHAMMAVYEFKL